MKVFLEEKYHMATHDKTTTTEPPSLAAVTILVWDVLYTTPNTALFNTHQQKM